MPLEKRYQASQMELLLEERWQAQGIYHFDADSDKPVFSIDTPPPTVSGKLHLGHVYSYSQPDFIARYQRMRGLNIYYPMGFDDNGLPTERLVERTLGIDSVQMDRRDFAEICKQFSAEAEEEYRTLWRRLGLSIDWRYTYRTISAQSQRAAQYSFVKLFEDGHVYRAKAPAIWCPECHASFAQADLEDQLRESEFITLPFDKLNGGAIDIATTRPELLAGCVAVFVHPDDRRYKDVVGQEVRVPLYGQQVPVLPDRSADPEKGTGAVMCCTFGDQTDVYWWRTYHLPLVEAIDEDGVMTTAAGVLQGLPVSDARQKIKTLLNEQGLVLSRQPVQQSIRVHERCDTPVEFRVVDQWFIRVLNEKEKFLQLGEQIEWHPEFMHARYRAWVENLSWDWSISRQRYYGVPFPVWFCQECGQAILADLEDLPVDPLLQSPPGPCRCGSSSFTADSDRMDTWATSSLSAMMISGWPDQTDAFARMFPHTLRPQAHEIIRTWLFYSIVMAWYHLGRLPWTDVMISGWGIAGEGMGKISKSRGSGPMPPLEMVERYSADALRYWAASTSLGRDAIISEEKAQMGKKLATKLWNVARFSEPFISTSQTGNEEVSFTPADRWILAACSSVVEKVTAAFESYEYSSARTEVENFFWHDLADNYIEIAKLRLYDPQHAAHSGARYALRQVLKTVLKLLAPLLPYITEAIWLEMFQSEEGGESIHQSQWPEAKDTLLAIERRPITGSEGHLLDLSFGELLVSIATTVRRFKSEHSLSLGSELACLQVAATDPALIEVLKAAAPDLKSVTRARVVEVVTDLDSNLQMLSMDSQEIRIGVCWER